MSFFITFEGCEGSGKTTQARLLLSYLEKCNIRAVITKEPGGTKLANQIRSFLLSEEVQDPMTEFLLITAARRDHLQQFIQPHLGAKYFVICDRFLDSSLAYQG